MAERAFRTTFVFDRRRDPDKTRLRRIVHVHLLCREAEEVRRALQRPLAFAAVPIAAFAAWRGPAASGSLAALALWGAGAVALLASAVAGRRLARLRTRLLREACSLFVPRAPGPAPLQWEVAGPDVESLLVEVERMVTSVVTLATPVATEGGRPRSKAAARIAGSLVLALAAAAPAVRAQAPAAGPQVAVGGFVDAAFAQNFNAPPGRANFFSSCWAWWPTSRRGEHHEGSRVRGRRGGLFPGLRTLRPGVQADVKGRLDRMSLEYAIGFVLSVLLLAYLAYALLRPERF